MSSVGVGQAPLLSSNIRSKLPYYPSLPNLKLLNCHVTVVYCLPYYWMAADLEVDVGAEVCTAYRPFVSGTEHSLVHYLCSYKPCHNV